VDGSLATIQLAIRAQAGLLLVHHGLFWSRRTPWTGVNYRLLRLLLDNDLAVYSAHLPLDAHPRIGNNVLCARALGFRRTRPFFECKGVPIGLRTTTRLPRAELHQRLRSAVGGGEVKLLPGGPEICRQIGLCTGGAGGDLAQAAAEGVDTFITGEGPHWTFALALDLGINVFYAGHYATETFGVRALGRLLGQRFKLPQVFLDAPSGL
jgi:dinuclear metal center YbgI/SA1388 family protein